ncbi:transmembrane sensor [Mucilaginibacter sp. HD30]
MFCVLVIVRAKIVLKKMKKDDIKEVLKKVDSGNCTPEEERIAKLWLFQLNKDKELDLTEKKLNLASTKMWATIKKDLIQKSDYHTIKLWPRIAVAALALLFIGAGLFYFRSLTNNQVSIQHNVVQNDIEPGKQGATLTLADGKKIRLSDVLNGKLVEQAGVTIRKAADGELVYEITGSGTETHQLNTISTANAETYRVKLPDGSLVWLNAASSLTYSPALTEAGARRVKLSGEAYFEVAKDKSHPFIVQAAGQEVQVLGTHFNVNAYINEPALVTTLLEGSVKVTTGSLKKLLKPGEQAVNADGVVNVSEANIDKAMDWKNDEFYVNHIDFKTAMRKIARWYDVEVIYNSSVPDDMEIGGWVSRNEKLSAVLHSIESAGIVHFKVNGRKIYVSK